ncbi:MAG: RsmD family RNA methyltransferase, partial [Wenzhouxiangellaceae bacterium]
MSGAVRIISGQWRGRRLRVPDLDGLRPTGDRAREVVFNWLQDRVHGTRCLDLFAGTGALGLEAASRGASRVTLIERDRRLAEALRRLASEWPGSEVL